MAASDASEVVARVDAAAHDAAELAKLQHWVRRYFGDTTPGAATARFHEAVEQLLRRWDEVAATHGEG